MANTTNILIEETPLVTSNNRSIELSVVGSNASGDGLLGVASTALIMIVK